MLLVRELLGLEDEPRFAGRRVERLPVGSADAAKRRLRGRTSAGTDVALDLERGSYLRHGAVLADDGERIVVVERPPEQALVVRPALTLDPQELLAQAVRLGHAFGNQHVPVEVEGGEVRVPITTSPDVAADTVRSLAIDAEVSVRFVRLGCERPLGALARAH